MIQEYENLGKDDSTPVADENSRAETEVTEKGEPKVGIEFLTWL